jgi:hypothetical protein
MKKKKIRVVVSSCIHPHKLCRAYFSYEPNNYYYYFPLMISRKLFLGLEECDFITNGYTIRRVKDITRAESKDDICLRILEAEGVVDQIETPPVDIACWKTAFESLHCLNINIIVRKESLHASDREFVIGRIEHVEDKNVYVRHFDGDGVWQDVLYQIPYCEITSVTFHSRYVDIFSKYLDKVSENSANQNRL